MSAFFQPGYLPAQTLAGHTYHGTTTYAGVAVPIYSSTSPTFALWNPLGSNKILIPYKLSVGVEATNTAVIATLGLGQVINTGGAYATGLPIAAWTDTTPWNGRVGHQDGRQGRFALSATLTSAANFFYNLGFSQATTALAPGLVSMQHNFDGGLAIAPGSLIHLVGVPAAPAEQMIATISWFEIDYSPA
jgi:hypothetical protein